MSIGQTTPRITLEDRFWSKVDKSGECWIWTSALDINGYGKISIGGRGGRMVKAHRLAYEWASGNSPGQLDICHTCDTPACVRNDDAGVYIVNDVTLPRFGHLFAGTERDNVRDMMAKGRAADLTGRIGRQGERSHLSTLTDADVIAIRAAHTNGTMSQHALARQYSVNQSTISMLIRHKTWAHLP